MAAQPSAPTEPQFTGFKYFKKLRPLFARLHDAGCARDKAGNRALHFDEYCSLLLLALFNPILASLRAVPQASELAKVQDKLGCRRTSLARDPRLKDLRHVVTLVDGTLLKALPRIAEAMWLTTRTGAVHHAWRLHTQFELDKHVPLRMDLTDGKNSGPSDEKAVLRRHLQPGRCYVLDRWYAQFTLFNDIRQAGSSYVCRLRDNSAFAVVEERPLTPEAREANVVRDVVVRLGLSSKGEKRPDHPIRLVIVRARPHAKRSHRKGNTGAGPSDGLLRIATDLLDVPAEVIALIYLYRYTIELFFRFFKHVLGCRHLLSDRRRGIEIQTYCAIIACMLISLYTGRKPTLRTYEMICYFLMGWASEAELAAHLEKLREHDRRQAERRNQPAH